MLPKSLSATSLQVAALCMDRWKHEYFDKAEGFSGVAANIGSSVHGALEKYVEAVYINKTREPDLKFLEGLYAVSFMETFGHADTSTDEYIDGLAMVKKWFARTDFTGVEVISVEVKKQMQIPVEYQGQKVTIPFSYIIDRLDKLGPGEYRVVDYKTVRVPIQPDDLENKIQARAYALSVQRDYPDAEKIRVVFDLLRHDQIGLIFTKEDNFKTAHYIMNEAQRIVDTDETQIVPTLNMECGYCIKASTCPVLKTNIDAGGLHSLTPEQKAERKYQAEALIKANKVVLEQLEELLLVEAVERDELGWKTPDGGHMVEIGAPRRRVFDAYQAAEIMGPKLFAQMGSMTIGNLEKIIGDDSLDPDMRAKLKALLTWTQGDLKAKVKKVNTLV